MALRFSHCFPCPHEFSELGFRRNYTELQDAEVEELKESCRTRASLDPHLKADLRGHHFAFGTHDEGSAMQSCSQAAFTEKRWPRALCDVYHTMRA